MPKLGDTGLSDAPRGGGEQLRRQGCGRATSDDHARADGKDRITGCPKAGAEMALSGRQRHVPRIHLLYTFRYPPILDDHVLRDRVGVQGLNRCRGGDRARRPLPARSRTPPARAVRDAPGGRLQQLEHAILTGDPALDLPAAPVTAGPVRCSRGGRGYPACCRLISPSSPAGPRWSSRSADG